MRIFGKKVTIYDVANASVGIPLGVFVAVSPLSKPVKLAVALATAFAAATAFTGIEMNEKNSTTPMDRFIDKLGVNGDLMKKEFRISRLEERLSELELKSSKKK